MSRFVRPEITILKISNGDTLTVKQRLNAGEQRALFNRMYLAGVDGTLKVNPLQTGVSLVLAYLLDWSLVGDDGTVRVIREQPIEVVSRALDELDPEDFAEIKAAIETHDAAIRAARSEEKKVPSGEPPLRLISSSPVGVAGDMSGSRV